MEWRDSIGIRTSFGGSMRIRKGSLIKWVRVDDWYGELGVVYSVRTNALNQTIECKVHWTDGQSITYGEDEQDNFLKVVKF